jgi:hypothetical protein
MRNGQKPQVSNDRVKERADHRLQTDADGADDDAAVIEFNRALQIAWIRRFGN